MVWLQDNSALFMMKIIIAAMVQEKLPSRF